MIYLAALWINVTSYIIEQLSNIIRHLFNLHEPFADLTDHSFLHC